MPSEAREERWILTEKTICATSLFNSAIGRLQDFYFFKKQVLPMLENISLCGIFSTKKGEIQ
jgi:hypothetical protein